VHIAKLLEGKSRSPGWGELVSTLREHQNSNSTLTTVESDVISLIHKHCGLDTYDNVLMLSDAALEVLADDKKRLEKLIAEDEAALAEMRRNAYRLPDGRAIFESRDGHKWYFDDGITEVPANLVRQRVEPPRGGWPN